MKAKEGFKIREVCGEKIIVAEGVNNIDFSNIISMNDSSAYLWESLGGKDFTCEDMANLLTERYEVSYEQALEDSKRLAELWNSAGIIDK